MTTPTFQAGGKTYEVVRIGVPKAGDKALWSGHVIDIDNDWRSPGGIHAVVREVAPRSPFDGAGKSYPPDMDGDQLTVRFPVQPSVPQGHLALDIGQRGDIGRRGEYHTVFFDPVALAIDLADHFKAMGVTPLTEAKP